MAYARSTDPLTSHEAAASVDNITETQQAILKALKRSGTDVDLVDRYRNLKGAPRASESGIRSRRSELARLGLVKHVGTTKLASGRTAKVWQVA